MIGKKLQPASQKLVEGMGQQIESLEKQLAEVLTIQQQLLDKANRIAVAMHVRTYNLINPV